MTPDQLIQIEREIAGLTDSGIVANAGLIRADMLALVAAYREQGIVKTDLEAMMLVNGDTTRKWITRAKEAEARVKELERGLEIRDEEHAGMEVACQTLLSRVAVLREALKEIYLCATAEHQRALAKEALDTLDTAATALLSRHKELEAAVAKLEHHVNHETVPLEVHAALTERFKVWDNAPWFRSDGGPQAHHCLSHTNWLKLTNQFFPEIEK